MADLVWSDDLPTEPGWYWYDFDGQFGLTLAQVWVATDEVQARPLGAISRPVSCWKGRWAGPIPEPREGKAPEQRIQFPCSRCGKECNNLLGHFVVQGSDVCHACIQSWETHEAWKAR